MKAFVCLGVAAMLVFAAVDGAAAWQIVQLTDNDYNDVFPNWWETGMKQVSGSNIVWRGGVDYSSYGEIFLYDGQSVRQLTHNDVYDGEPIVCGSNVAWANFDYFVDPGGTDKEIYLYDGQTTRQITDNGKTKKRLRLWDGGMAWLEYDGTDYEVFNYDGTSIVQLTDDDYDQPSLDASGNYVGWSSDEDGIGHIMRYDGQAITQIAEDIYYHRLSTILLSEENVLIANGSMSFYHVVDLFTPEGKEELPIFSRGRNTRIDISGDRVVWDDEAYLDGYTYAEGVFLWDDGELVQITEHDKDFEPCVSDSFVAWCRWDGNDYEIFLYDGTSVMQVTDNDYDDRYPRLSDSMLVWQHWDGNDWEIQMTTVPEPSGVVLLLLTGLSCLGAWRARCFSAKSSRWRGRTFHFALTEVECPSFPMNLNEGIC